MRIVIATYGSLGDLHPAMALALGLQARGHSVSLVTNEQYRTKVERVGIGFHSLRPNLDDFTSDLKQQMMHLIKGPEVVIRQLIMPSIREMYADVMAAVQEADLLISGEILYVAPLVAQKTGIPWVSFALTPMSFFSACDPPVLTPFPYLAKLRRLGLWVNRPVIQFVKSATYPWSEPIRQFRKELGLPPGQNPIFEDRHSPDLVLAMFSRIIGEPQPDWLPQARVTGFVFYDRPLGGAEGNRSDSSSELSPELAQFLDAGEPPIVFTLGSAAVHTAGNFYIESVKAARELGKRAVFLVGVGEEPLESLPKSAIAVDYAPYSKIFPRAAAVVHQGGIGTTAQALRAGCPMLVVPYSHDQPDNAARVVRLGVARTLGRSHYTSDRAAKELSELLNHARYKEKALEIQKVIQAEDGLGTACDAIENYLGVGARFV